MAEKSKIQSVVFFPNDKTIVFYRNYHYEDDIEEDHACFKNVTPEQEQRVRSIAQQSEGAFWTMEGGWSFVSRDMLRIWDGFGGPDEWGK
jgi:hypothetical protein